MRRGKLKEKLKKVKEKHKEKHSKQRERKKLRKKKRMEMMKKHLMKTKVGDIFRSYPMTKLYNFVQRKLKSFEDTNTKISLYDPFKMGLELEEDNYDKICFHFTLAKPMEGVSIKGAATLFHWFNVYVFLDHSIVRSELDWDTGKDEDENTIRAIEACIKDDKIYPEYLKKLESHEAVLVQDIDDDDVYRQAALLMVTKEKLKEVIEKNVLVGKKYDFTQNEHCQSWCKAENEALGLGTKFSCKFINEFVNEHKVNKLVGNLVKRFAEERMEDEDGGGGGGGVKDKLKNMREKHKEKVGKLKDKLKKKN